MSEYVPKSGALKINGLGPKAQKLQAMREKAAQQKSGGQTKMAGATTSVVKGKDSFANTKKSTFQRKAT